MKKQSPTAAYAASEMAPLFARKALPSELSRAVTKARHTIGTASAAIAFNNKPANDFRSMLGEARALRDSFRADGWSARESRQLAMDSVAPYRALSRSH